MARFLHRYFSWIRRNANMVILAACFLAGFVLGIRMSHGAELSVSLMRSALYGTVSIVGLLTVQLLPFLFSALAVYFSKSQLLYGIAFLKAFLFAFIATAVSSVFGNAGWLARFLILFSDSLNLPLLWLYWLRHIPGKRAYQVADAIVLACCICLVGIADYILIMPLLQGI